MRYDLPVILRAAATAALVAAAILPASAAAAPTSGGARLAAPLAVAAADPPADAITFDDYELGTTITDEYADAGVVFTSDVFISSDIASPTAPVLSGVPRFHGDIDGRFVVPGTSTPTTVLGFTVDVGYINDRNSVEIAYYDGAGALIGSTRAQAYGINHIEVAARGIASFSVREVAFEGAGFEIDNLAIRRVAPSTTVTRMIEMGDSYSSGEGLTPEKGLSYDCGTDLHESVYYQDTTMPYYEYAWPRGKYCDTRTGSTSKPKDLQRRPRATYFNTCHRHRRAYPNQLRERLGVSGDNSLFVACSGATTANVGARDGAVQARFPKSPFAVHGGNTQLADAEEFVRTHGPADLVTIGVGGNDAGFGEIIDECFWHTCSAEPFASEVVSGINGTMFRNVRDTLVRLRSRFAPATIVAFGYPTIVDDPPHGCFTAPRIGDDELRWLRESVVPAINDAIKDAAAEAGVAYADVTSATAGHGVCSKDNWINNVRFGDDNWVIGNESFHPNQKGHDAIARLFVDRFTDGQGHLLLTNPEPSPPIRPGTGPEIHLIDLSVGAGQQCGASCLQPAACVQACTLHVQGAGFTPGTVLNATIESTPTALGQATADAGGNLSADFALPPGVGPGEHVVTVDGHAPDGTHEYGIQDVRVFARAPARIAARVRRARDGAHVRRLTVTRLPKGARVTVVCARGLRGVERVLAGARAKRRGGCPYARRVVVVRKGGRRSLTRPFRAAALAPRTVVRVLVAAPGQGGRTLDVRVRRRARPQLVRGCLDPGEMRPKRC